LFTLRRVRFFIDFLKFTNKHNFTGTIFFVTRG
jgi:hypothetical protein